MQESVPTASGWAVAHTHAHREATVLEHLARQHFEAYCPQVRRRLRQRQRFVDVVRPLFPGYVFVCVHPARSSWRPILSTVGVRRLIRFGDRLGMVPSGLIEALRQREIDGLVTAPPVPLEIGQQVRVTSGPFEGAVAEILSVGEHQRVVVLMSLMQRSIPVVLHAREVVSVADPVRTPANRRRGSEWMQTS